MSNGHKLTEKVTIPFDPSTIERANTVRRKSHGERIPSLAAVLRDAAQIGLRALEHGEQPAAQNIT